MKLLTGILTDGPILIGMLAISASICDPAWLGLMLG